MRWLIRDRSAGSKRAAKAGPSNKGRAKSSPLLKFPCSICGRILACAEYVLLPSNPGSRLKADS